MDELVKNKELKNNKNLLIIGITVTLIILLGSTYAFFTYYKSIQAFVLTTNGISATFTNGSNQLTFGNAYPISDEFAKEHLDDLTYIDFTVATSATNPDEAVTYELFLTEKNGNTLSGDYLKVYLTDNNDTEITSPKTYNSLSYTTYTHEPTGRLVYKDTKTGTFTKNYRLYVWLDKNYEQNTSSQTFSFYVNIYAYNDVAPELAATTLTNKIKQLKSENPSCNYTVDDYDENELLEATYLSGSKTGDCAIDFNYVWYSGKMWRIVAIYPDGTMKLVTDNNITSIAYNETDNVTYYNKSTSAKSYMFQWLNEDFLDTLYNYENIIVHDANTHWNATMRSTTPTETKPSKTDATMIPTSTSPVGLLNSYEYYEAYQNASRATNYLNIEYNWWLLDPYYNKTNPSNIRCVDDQGNSSGGYVTTYIYGVRPSIILQSNLSFNGRGIKTDPYKIVGDISSPTLGTTKVNERVFEKNNETYSYNGEYVKIKYNNELSPLYRIVGVEKDPNDSSKTITKLVAMDYADDKATKKFATSNSGTIYGSGTTVNSDKTTWYSYLNGTDTGNVHNDDGWFDRLSYKSLLTSGTYYMGNGDTASYYNYKGAICATADILSSTRTCNKTTNSGTFNVGLLRYGEMFATQQAGGSSDSIKMRLITKYNSSGVRYVGIYGDSNPNYPTYEFGARPTIYLSSDVKFLTCSSSKCDGTEDYSYEVGL